MPNRNRKCAPEVSIYQNRKAETPKTRRSRKQVPGAPAIPGTLEEVLLVRAPEGFLGGRQWGWERPGLGAPKKACKAETIKISETVKDLNCPPSPIPIGAG